MRNKKTIEDLGLYNLPPQNLEAEESVLCSLILDNSDLITIRGILEPVDFYRASHQKIFTAILELADQENPIDLVTLTNHLRGKNELETIGGASYLARLVDEVPIMNPIPHAEIIKEKATRRQLLEEINNLARMAFDDQVTTGEISDKTMEISSNFAEGSMKGKRSKMQKLEITTEDIQNHFPSVIETPLKLLNDEIGGFAKEEITVIGGRSGMCKTALALEILSHTAIDNKIPVAYFGSQMSEKRIYARLVAQRCSIPLRTTLGKGMPSDEEIKRMAQSQKQINAAPIYEHIIKDRISMPDLKTQVLRTQDKIKQDLGLIIIENLQQISWPDKKFRGQEQANFIFGKLKSFIYEIKTPIIVSSQLNRDTDDREDKRPMTADIFGKDAEELADNILLLFRPNFYEKREIQEKGRPERDAEIIIGKGGPPMILILTLWGDYLSWRETES